MRGAAKTTAEERDVLMVLGKDERRDSYQVLRSRKSRIEAGELRAVQEGKPMDGELVRLEPRSEAPGIYDVNVEYAPGASDAGGTRGDAVSAGPAQVASKGYRKNWSRVFGSRRAPPRRDKKTLN